MKRLARSNAILATGLAFGVAGIGAYEINRANTPAGCGNIPEAASLEPADAYMASQAKSFGRVAVKREESDHIAGEVRPDSDVRCGFNVLIKTSDGKTDYLFLASMFKRAGHLAASTTFRVILAEQYGRTAATRNETGLIGDFPPGADPWYGYSKDFSPDDQVDAVDHIGTDQSSQSARLKKAQEIATIMALYEQDYLSNPSIPVEPVADNPANAHVI